MALCRWQWPTWTYGLLTLAACCVAGCRTFETPADLTLGDSNDALAQASADEPSSTENPNAILDEPRVPPELTDGGWIAALADPDTGALPEYRWRHARLDRLASLPERQRPDLTQFLVTDDAVVTTNAAILLARSGETSVDLCLVESVRNTELSMPQRRAAAETLSRLETAAAGPALSALLDEFGQPSAEGYAAELHAELLRGLARHVDAPENPYFISALTALSGEVRQAGLVGFTVNTTGTLPQTALDLRSDAEPRVRAAALACLAARRHPEALSSAQAALTDFHLDVRLAAIAVLGQQGSDEARAVLQRLTVNDAEAVRCGAVMALAVAGDDVTVFASVKDPSWQVRRSVGRALALFPIPRGATIARQLLADRSPEVRRSVIASLERWPLVQAGPVLMTAMSDAPYQSRQQAAEQLARRWPPAERFAVDSPADQRATQLAALQETWQATHATGPAGAIAAGHMVAARSSDVAESAPAPPDDIPPAQSPTAEVGSADPFAPGEQEAAAPSVDAQAGEAEQPPGLPAGLSVEDVVGRRRAAQQLADEAAEQALAPDVVARLVELGMAETDAGVWRELLRAVRADPSEPAQRLACVGTSHAVAEVRRLACGHLGLHSDPRYGTLLLRMIDDPNAAVVRAAVEALGKPGMLTAPAALERLLASPDKALRVAAARSLAINGFDSGSAALDRLARDADADVRRQAAVAMGQLHEKAFLATLIQLLDDDLSIRLAAITSLSSIAGEDVNLREDEAALPLAEQVQGWKRWWDGERIRQASREPQAVGERR